MSIERNTEPYSKATIEAELGGGVGSAELKADQPCR